MDQPKVNDTGGWVIFVVLAAYLTCLFVWRLFVPAHEYAMRGEQVFDIFLNLVMLAVLFGYKRRLTASLPADDARWNYGRPLYAAGIVSGIGLFLLRFTSNSAWWTGHFRYDIG